MELTELSKRLLPKLDNTFQTIDELLNITEFNPAELDQTFNIAAPDFFTRDVLPKYFSVLHTLAPEIKLNIVNWHEGTLRDLVAGKIDMALGAVPEAPADIHQKLLHKSDFVAVGNADIYHQDKLSLEAYLAAEHVIVHMESKGDTPVDAWLQGCGQFRNIVLRVPHFTGAFAVSSQSNLLLTTSETLADALSLQFSVRKMQLPFGVSFAPFCLYWHQRHHKDRSHIWFREQLGSAVKALIQH